MFCWEIHADGACQCRECRLFQILLEEGLKICFHLEGLLEVASKVANQSPSSFGHPMSFLFGMERMYLLEDDLDCLGGQSKICSHWGCFVEKTLKGEMDWRDRC